MPKFRFLFAPDGCGIGARLREHCSASGCWGGYRFGVTGFGQRACPITTMQSPQIIRLPSPTASLVLVDGHEWWPAAAGTAWQDKHQRAREADTQCGDGIRHVALRPQRQILWVGNRRKRQIASLARRGKVLRGEWSPVRRPGTHMLRCRDLRGGESRANRGLRSVLARPLAGVRDSRARSASGVWHDRPCSRARCRPAAWRASRGPAGPPLPATRSAAILRPPARSASHRRAPGEPAIAQTATSVACCCGVLLPSRHLIACQASAASSRARVLAATGRCVASRRNRLAGRPRPDLGTGGNGASPGRQTIVVGRMPAT
jgi:hypothetical protein